MLQEFNLMDSKQRTEVTAFVFRCDFVNEWGALNKEIIIFFSILSTQKEETSSITRYSSLT